MNVYTFTTFNIEFVWNVHNSKVFIAKTMLDVITMLPNPTFTRWCKPETGTNTHPLMLSNTCGEMTKRFTNISGITLSTLIFISTLLNNEEGTWSLYLKKLLENNRFITTIWSYRCYVCDSAYYPARINLLLPFFKASRSKMSSPNF